MQIPFLSVPTWGHFYFSRNASIPCKMSCQSPPFPPGSLCSLSYSCQTAGPVTVPRTDRVPDREASRLQGLRAEVKGQSTSSPVARGRSLFLCRFQLPPVHLPHPQSAPSELRLRHRSPLPPPRPLGLRLTRTRGHIRAQERVRPRSHLEIPTCTPPAATGLRGSRLQR